MEDKTKFASPTLLAVSPPKLTFHRKIARGAFGVVYLVSDGTETQYAVKRTRKFGKRRSRELINLGMCNGAKNVIKYYGSFYTIDPCGNFIQNSVLEHFPHNLRAYFRMIKCELNKRSTHSVDHQKYVQNVVKYSIKEDSNDFINEIGKYSGLCDKMISILRNIGMGIQEIHDRGLMHRDLKPDNILIDDLTNPQQIRICDLGSAKKFEKFSANGSEDLKEQSTPYICSRWYRAPELLFGSTCYGVNIDCWSFGCICVEVLILKPLFIPKENCDSQQILKIMEILGSPTRYEIENILKIIPRKNIKEKVKELFRICEFREKLDVIVDSLTKGNEKLERIGIVAKSLLRWFYNFILTDFSRCPGDRITIKQALHILK